MKQLTKKTKPTIKIYHYVTKKLYLNRKNTYTKYLELLAKDADLINPEEIKLVIAKLKSRNTKCLVCYVYDSYLNFLGIPWEKPEYRQEHKRVFIPTEDELKLAINSGRKTSYLFSLLIYETGARVNEAERIEWTDLDSERNKITIKASKNGNARILTVSNHLIQKLLNLPKKEKTVFPILTRKVR